MKDNEIAELVNEITNVVPVYAKSQCLRQVVSQIVMKHVEASITRITQEKDSSYIDKVR